LAVPFIFVADVLAFLVNTMKRCATHNTACSFLEIVFNYRLSRQYKIVENVFDTPAAKFRGLFKKNVLPCIPTKLQLFV
jgi:hypothetical protein